MKYKVVLFDLDGTLTDPQTGICRSINYALDYFGAKQRPLDQLTRYIGPPLVDSFTELLGREKAAEAVEKYRERFSVKGLYENEIYPNVAETLANLQQQGYILCTASSKPQIFVEKILKHFDIYQYFTIVGGASLDGTVSEKEDVINCVLNQLDVDCKDIVMVGDTRFDLIGAGKMHIDAIGVTYGFGSEEELKKYPHIALIDDITHIVNLL